MDLSATSILLRPTVPEQNDASPTIHEWRCAIGPSHRETRAEAPSTSGGRLPSWSQPPVCTRPCVAPNGRRLRADVPGPRATCVALTRRSEREQHSAGRAIADVAPRFLRAEWFLPARGATGEPVQVC